MPGPSICKRLLMGSFAMFAVGCSYQEPPRDSPAATLAIQFDLRDVIPGFARFQDFGAFLDAGCEKGNGILGSAALGSKTQEATRRVAAGERMYVRTAWINRANAGSEQVALTRCVNLVSFIPEAGGVYLLEQVVAPAGYAGVSCAARLVDSQSGRAPASLQEHPSVGRCSEIYLNLY